VSFHLKLVRPCVAFVGFVLFACLLTTGLLFASGHHQKLPGYIPKDGFVPDKITAIALARAVLSPMYRENKIEIDEEFTVLSDTDTGHISSHTTPATKYQLGGRFQLEISKSKGCILRLIQTEYT
jgi:hypothetical protein